MTGRPDIIEPDPPKRRFRSEEEGLMRGMVAKHLRARWPGARIIHEFPLRYSARSLDMAAILPAEIVAVEIKSSRDVLDRLEHQLRAFAPICTRIMVCLAPKWNRKLPQTVRVLNNGGTAYSTPLTEAQAVIQSIRETHIETWTCCSETGRFENTDGGWGGQRFPWPARMLDVLHVAELERILSGGAVLHRVRSHRYCVEAIHHRLTGPQIIRAVCAALRARPGFAVESDPPIGIDVAPPITTEARPEQMALIG